MTMFSERITGIKFHSRHEMDDFCTAKFLSCVDRALDKYGRTTKDVIFFHFETESGLNRKEIPKKPEIFVATIQKIFGAGAGIVQASIIDEMRSVSLSIDLDKKDVVASLQRARESIWKIAEQDLID